MKKIPLTQGKYALVDDSDFDYLNQWRWYFNSEGYVVRSTSRKLGKQRTIRMHRVINQTPINMDTDHINRNKLDNRRCNLITVTRRQNQMNVGLRKDNTSGIKGVCWDKQSNKWRVSVKISGRQYYLGLFNDKLEAINRREGYNFG